TCSRVFLRSAVPPVAEAPPEKTLPRQTVPVGPVTIRSRSLLRLVAAAGVDGKSVHARVALNDSPVLTEKVKVRSSLVEPVAKGVAVSFTVSLRVWPVKNRAFSSSTRPQPGQLAGMAVVPAMLTAELTRVAL